ncbi:multidrug effflux MFS transporter [Aurantiacibacter gangjinensis]|uniref:Bcr/CflA family efflux transporter n=1 Tax=Aurantiacibacter gangjinensis TaxID=502682 RepID=A0A0G9MRG0_9SPHN|nr:multidrug effflux MFS transporter [Aurantiacibacter gangjinensis]APE27959.1 MFS family multidrug efflux protein, similarity to bicyclomycin resistance protein Bcr [Aurantiacibacter gangjinensis]KLE31903.1 Bcr/CflA subfamily drug resistance transporter [Aurantiacibacter gangjinensis]
MSSTKSKIALKPRALGERELIVLMALLMSLQAFGIDAMLPALGQMAEEMGADGNRRQWVIAAYFLGAGVGAFFPGAFADKFGRRPILGLALIAYVSLSLACALATDYDVLLAIRLAQGVLCAGLSVVPAAIVRDHVGGDRMARLMSLIMMIFLIVPILAPAIGQAIMYFAGWRAIFGAMAVMGTGVGLWVWGRLPETLQDDNRQDIDPRTILRNMGTALTDRGAIGYVVGSALVFGSLFGFLNSSQQLIAETFGMGDYFALIFGGAVLGMVAANFTNSRIVERFGARRVSHVALLVFIGISIGQLLSARAQPQSLAEFIVLMSISMAMLGFIGANFASIAMQPFYHIAGAASSAQTAVRMSTGAVLGALIGNLYDGTALPLAASMFSCGLLALAIVLFSERGKLFRRKTPPGTSAPIP